MRYSIGFFSAFVLLFAFNFQASAQEFEGPLPKTISYPKTAQKPSALALPFFDDFTNYDGIPNQSLWADRSVWVNNTMPSGIKSRGCATFDGYNLLNHPYDSMSANAQVYADTLTSQAIDLSGHSAADSIYLSFTYQAKGWGFSPKPQDSLMLYFLKGNGQWQKVWSTHEIDYTDFKNAIVAVKDTSYFKSEFRFRLINKATVGISNSNWHIDYVYLDKNRNNSDTLFNDLAFTRNPESLMNDFTAMPFRHFKTNPSAFLSNKAEAYLKNNGYLSATVNYGMTTKEIISGTAIGAETGSSLINSNQENSLTFSMPDIGSFPGNNPEDKCIFEHQYYATSIYPGEHKENDTIKRAQVFDNFFAYDDGSAEQTYFLNLFPNALGRIALEYALYVPDTIRGVSIYLPRQVPSGMNKEFSLAIYKDITINGGQDDLVYEENFLFPEYTDAVNEFTTYAFDEAVPMADGLFYIVLTQAAGGGSDSLYIGLDKNREGANHRYFDVEGYWQSSTIDGAIMMRPLVGKKLPPASIEHPVRKKVLFQVYPNPAQDILTIRMVNQQSSDFTYSIFNIEGRLLLKKETLDDQTIDIATLQPGIYFLHLQDEKGNMQVEKLIKH